MIVLNEKRFIAKPQLVCLYHPSWMKHISHTLLGEWFLFGIKSKSKEKKRVCGGGPIIFISHLNKINKDPTTPSQCMCVVLLYIEQIGYIQIHLYP